MSNTKGILKLANIKGQYKESIAITGRLNGHVYHCLNIMIYQSSSMFVEKYSAFLSVCHASDNTNNHYGMCNNQLTKLEAISKAIKDSGLTCCNLTDNNLNITLINLTKTLNPDMTHFEIF